MTRYDLASYRTYIKFSHQKHLLVEGTEDKRIFLLFLDELVQHTSPTHTDYGIRIDTAEQLKDFGDGIGNRKKVEVICHSISDQPHARRLVGFVDREFREFERTPKLKDCINAHNIMGRLVWSRGHSIENYYFDFDVLRTPLLTFSVTEHFCDALDLFEVVFEQAIRLACAASLAGEELEKLNLVKRSSNPSIFGFPSDTDETLVLDSDKWKTNLMKHQRLSRDMAEELVSRFEFWNSRVEHSNFLVTRWMCHGHIGLAFIWAVYSRCVLEVCLRKSYSWEQARSQAQRVLKADESVRFNSCATTWVRKALGNHCTYPTEVFEMLNVSIPQNLST